MAKHGNIAAGDTILVQCFDHEKEKLLAETEYRVTERSTSLKTVAVDQVQTRQFENIVYQVERIRDWWFPKTTAEGDRAVESTEIPATTETRTRRDPDASEGTSKPVVKWNVGSQSYDVRIGGKAVSTWLSKDDALKAAKEV